MVMLTELDHYKLTLIGMNQALILHTITIAVLIHAKVLM